MGVLDVSCFPIWAVFGYGLFFDMGCFWVWAVFWYGLFSGMGCFSIWGVFQIWAVLEKSEFCQCTGLSIFGREVVLGYFAKISILPFFPLACQKQGIG
jgi:hypothetical protein